MLTKMQNFIFQHQLRKNLKILLFQKYSIVRNTDIEICNKENQIANMDKSILKVLNSSSITKLSKFIDSSLVEQIIEHRKANGLYKSLDELNNRISHDTLVNLYNLYCDNEKKVKKWRGCIKPDIKKIQVPKSIVGIHVGFETISWTLLTLDHKIVDWNCILWPDKLKSLNPSNLANLVTTTIQQLPLSDCYVFEEFKKTMKLVSIRNIQQQFTVGVLSCLKLMNEQRTSNGLSARDNVYILRPLTTANFYRLRVGSEVMATQYIMETLLNNVKNDDSKLWPICISSEAEENFNSKTSAHKEEIGWSLLKALTFVHLLELFNTNYSVCETSDNLDM